MSKKGFFGNCLSFFMRLFITDIGCFIVSIFVVSVNTYPLVRTLIQLACLTVTIAITYSFFHKLGDNDAVLVNSGYNKSKPLKGLWIALCANIPFWFSGILLVLSRFGLTQSYSGMYKIINSFYSSFLFSALPSGVAVTDLTAVEILLALSVLFIVPITAMFSYILGQMRFSFNELVFYKKRSE